MVVVPLQMKRPVALTARDREELIRLTRTGVWPASMIMRARVLLALDTSVGAVDSKEVIAARLGVSGEMLRLVAKRFAETGGDVQATIARKVRGRAPVPSAVTGEVQARLIALACSQPPPGHARWSLRLLEKHVALTEDIPDLDHSTIGRVLKNGTASPSEKVLEHPTAGERGVRGPHAGRAGGLRPAVRPRPPGGVHGRETLPIARSRP
jgi:transposase